ncbi:hypothetical protein [Streptomyces sp. NPDC004291]
MAKSSKANENPRRMVLRRWSFPVLSWISVLVLGLLNILFIAAAEESGAGGESFMASAVCLVTIALIRRVLCSRIVLGADALRVVNPLMTYVIPYRLVSEVGTSKDGTLTVRTTEGGEVYATAFGGSLLDHFVGSADRAVVRVREVVRQRRNQRGAEEEARKFVTVSWIADLCLLIAVGLAVATAIGVGN